MPLLGQAVGEVQVSLVLRRERSASRNYEKPENAARS